MNTITQPLLQRIYSTQRIQLEHFSAFRNILCGAGMCYAIEQNKLWHVPIAFLVPSIYAGYQGYKHRILIKDFILKSV